MQKGWSTPGVCRSAKFTTNLFGSVLNYDGLTEVSEKRNRWYIHGFCQNEVEEEGGQLQKQKVKVSGQGTSPSGRDVHPYSHSSQGRGFRTERAGYQPAPWNPLQ